MSYRKKSQMSLAVLPLFFAASSLCAQPSTPAAKPSQEVGQYLADFQHIIKQHALYADSLNWGQLNREVTEKSQGLATVEECKPVIDHILQTLRKAGDKHSFFIPKEKAARQTSASYEAKQAESQYLGDGIGYLKIPALSSMNASVGQTFSQGIRSQLAALQTQYKLTGWVVDLRHNTGGNVHPMIEGLQPLLGEGLYGYFIFPRRTLKKAMPLWAWSGKKKEQPAVKATKTPQRVAVLIDSLTGSSGEMVALAFKGRSNAKFFGQPSAGYTTTNQDFKLSDGAYLLLATGYMADKKRRTYLPNIVPDVVVEYAPATAPDKTIEAARTWLLEAR
ncbi:MAG TPA: S41 family peptidase [Hymenobacter sp.]|uniref:S41 family peptidase n=1 Tax=Hymenobacter sp. TaxID=1898978 RepID=UPI002D7FA649|nr:S41 family peptidase [Hymenobacter sp.]HET9503074.1 S41 family peptidase [Hymenobacter sp.]